MPAPQFLRLSSLKVSCVFFTLIALASVEALTAYAQQPTRAKPTRWVPGQRAIVFDERFSALRTQPDVKAPMTQRLRRHHIVGILRVVRDKQGRPHFYRVAVTRNTRGWILAEALGRAGRAEDAERLMKLIDETNDDFVRAQLARLCVDEFRLT